MDVVGAFADCVELCYADTHIAGLNGALVEVEVERVED